MSEFKLIETAHACDGKICLSPKTYKEMIEFIDHHIKLEKENEQLREQLRIAGIPIGSMTRESNEKERQALENKSEQNNFRV